MYTGIQFSGYKLFCEENIIEFDKITNVNVIIGKNNSGKSSLLDVIEMAYDLDFFEKQRRQIDLIRVNIPITRDMVQSIFLWCSLIGEWSETDYWKKVEGKNVLLELGGTRNLESSSGYRAIETDDIPIIDFFQKGLNVFEQKREIIYLDVYPQKEILFLKKNEIWNFPVQEREPVIWLEYF